MTDKIEEKKEIFIQKIQECKDIYKQDEEFAKRIWEAEQNIILLQEEKDELKKQRPILLADNEDISELNQRLKDIDEEIDINQDTITGLKTKREEYHVKKLYARQDANSAYEEYIKLLIVKVRNDYMKIAPKLAELIKDNIVLEDLRDGDSNGSAYFTTEHIKCLPNYKDPEHPLLKYNYYNIVNTNTDRVLKKYNIPHFNIRHISLSDYNVPNF